MPATLRVTLVAMTIGTAMGQCVQQLGEALGKRARVTVITPSHYADKIAGVTWRGFPTGANPRRALLGAMNPASHLRLLAALRAQPADIIHLYNGHGYPWALTLAALRGKTPLAVTLHDPDPHPGNMVDALSFRMGKFTLARADAILVHDAIFRPKLERKFPGKTIAVIPLGSLAGRYLQYRKPGITRRRNVLFFGRVEHYKGIEIALRALLVLPGDVTFTLAGGGALSDVEQSLIAQLGPRVQVHNRFIEDSEAAEFLQCAGVLVLPYRQATQSNLPQIAHGFELPVVASAVGTFATEVPRLGGIVVPPEDPAALADAITAQLDAPSQGAGEQLSFESLAPLYMELYERIARK